MYSIVELINWAVLLGLVGWIFLILRFIQPELIYTLRQSIVKVEINKSWLEVDSDIENSEVRFLKALTKDFRSESRRSDIDYIDERIQKVKELYRFQDIIDEDRNYQNCIIELSNLLGNLAHNIVLDKENRYPVVLADEVLKFLQTKRLENKTSGKDTLVKDLNSDRIEDWFVANPISVEQSVEVLIAIIYAILLRDNENI